MKKFIKNKKIISIIIILIGILAWIVGAFRPFSVLKDIWYTVIIMVASIFIIVGLLLYALACAYWTNE